MGRQFITPSQDASIYEQVPSRNTGADEILEVGKTTATDGAARVLIQFDLDKLTAPFSSSYFLNLRIAHAEKFQNDQTLEFYKVTGDDGARSMGLLIFESITGANSESVTIDGKAYNFFVTNDAFGDGEENDQDGNVFVGVPTSTPEELGENFIAALNLTTSSFTPFGGAGIAYAFSTTKHPTVFTPYGGGGPPTFSVELSAIKAGVAGNVILSSSDQFTVSIGLQQQLTGSMTGGVDPTSGSWDEGTGFFEQDLENPRDGASWQLRNNDDDTWVFANGTSSLGGSTGSLIATNSFDWKPTDIRLDVTDQVRAWLTGSQADGPNNGLLIKIPTVDEDNAKVNTNIRFFSRNTHTVYPPTLEAVWNTQTMSVAPNCGLSAAPEEIEIFVQNLRPEMISGSTHRIRFGVRGSNIVKSFTNAARFTGGHFLPSGSHIGVQDAATKSFIVPFDTGSFLSADNTGSYFDLKIENMYINRTYKILVQTSKPWGTEVVDTGHTFRVV